MTTDTKATSLHGKIINLAKQLDEAAKVDPSYCKGYALGHRDARHAAAELASEYEASHDALVAQLVALLIEAPIFFAPQYDFEGRKSEWVKSMNAALLSHKGER
jgi:hypothetical protein